MKAVSANIMMGQFCKGGTNNFDVMFDEEKYIEQMQQRVTQQGEEMAEAIPDQLEAEIENNYQQHHYVNENSFNFGYQLNNLPEHKIATIPIATTKTKIRIVKSKNQAAAPKAPKKVADVAEAPAEAAAATNAPAPKKKIVIRKK